MARTWETTTKSQGQEFQPEGDVEEGGGELELNESAEEMERLTSSQTSSCTWSFSRRKRPISSTRIGVSKASWSEVEAGGDVRVEEEAAEAEREDGGGRSSSSHRQKGLNSSGESYRTYKRRRYQSQYIEHKIRNDGKMR